MVGVAGLFRHLNCTLMHPFLYPLCACWDFNMHATPNSSALLQQAHSRPHGEALPSCCHLSQHTERFSHMRDLLQWTADTTVHISLTRAAFEQVCQAGCRLVHSRPEGLHTLLHHRGGGRYNRWNGTAVGSRLDPCAFLFSLSSMHASCCASFLPPHVVVEGSGYRCERWATSLPHVSHGVCHYCLYNDCTFSFERFVI